MTFESCIFEEMDFGSMFSPQRDIAGTDLNRQGTDFGKDYAKVSTMILATHPSNTVIIRDCVFRNGNINLDREVSILLCVHHDGWRCVLVIDSPSLSLSNELCT